MSAPESHLDVALRDVIEADIEIFFEHQRDVDATAMAAFPSRDKEPHMAHWRRILTDAGVATKTVLLDGKVVGNVVSWEPDERRVVGYWIGKSYWGRGIATAALAQFLEQLEIRPIYAFVARHNLGSIRVLEKCGFVVAGENEESDIEEFIMILEK